MRLTKAKLIRLVKLSLEEIGYIEFKETIIGSQGFFVKKLPNGYYVTLGLTIDRYSESFTGSYYLSKTTCWASVWGDIPNESYERPGKFLTKEERRLYLNPDYNKTGVIDVWWDGNKETEIDNFLKVIKITEPRFINQPELIEKIEQSKEVQTLSMFAEKVIQSVNFNQLGFDFKFLPNKEIDEIPMVWFMAAEKVLKENNGILNANTVKMLAADAFRQKKLAQVNAFPVRVEN